MGNTGEELLDFAAEKLSATKKSRMYIRGSKYHNLFVSFSITTTREFAAAHQLRLYDGSLEPLHGHNWRVRLTVSTQKLDAIGVVMDFHELERLLDQIINPLHNRHLNEQPAFQKTNPSAENLAVHIGESLRLPDGIRLEKVEVWETIGNSAIYQP